MIDMPYNTMFFNTTDEPDDGEYFRHLLIPEDPFTKIMGRLRRAREEEDAQEAQKQLQEALEPLFAPEKERTDEPQEEPSLPPHLLDAALAREYVEHVIKITNSIMETCDRLSAQGVDVRAYREKAFDLGLTAMPPLILNPHVSPREQIRHAQWLGMNAPILSGLSGTVGHQARLFFSKLHGPEHNIVSVAGHRNEQAPIFLIGEHRGPQEYFHPLIRNAPSSEHFADGTSFDRQFFDQVQKAALNPQPLPPLRKVAAERLALQNDALGSGPR